MLNIFLAKLQKNFDIWASEIKIFLGFLGKSVIYFASTEYYLFYMKFK